MSGLTISSFLPAVPRWSASNRRANDVVFSPSAPPSTSPCLRRRRWSLRACYSSQRPLCHCPTPGSGPFTCVRAVADTTAASMMKPFLAISAAFDSFLAFGESFGVRRRQIDKESGAFQSERCRQRPTSHQVLNFPPLFCSPFFALSPFHQ